MNVQQGFAVWITGIPASGKSSITRELRDKLRSAGTPVVVLESDEMRAILTPGATYSLEERDRFYQFLVLIGATITRNGVSVIFDATANRRIYRDQARSLIAKFVEAYVQCPLDVCRERDPKGIYRRAAAGRAATVPGMQTPYEQPANPEITLNGMESPEGNAGLILEKLKQLLYI
jgi:adenylylsulfate kinase